MQSFNSSVHYPDVSQNSFHTFRLQQLIENFNVTLLLFSRASSPQNIFKKMREIIDTNTDFDRRTKRKSVVLHLQRTTSLGLPRHSLGDFQDYKSSVINFLSFLFQSRMRERRTLLVCVWRKNFLYFNKISFNICTYQYIFVLSFISYIKIHENISILKCFPVLLLALQMMTTRHFHFSTVPPV